jgi:hypothetical protein
MVIASIRLSPMDGEVGNQGEVDQFCKLDRLDDVHGLGDRNVAGATNAIGSSRVTTLLEVGL